MSKLPTEEQVAEFCSGYAELVKRTGICLGSTLNDYIAVAYRPDQANNVATKVENTAKRWIWELRQLKLAGMTTGRV